MSESNTVVIGNGWSAMGVAGILGAQGESVTWIEGSGTRLIAPLPTLEAGLGAEAWIHLCRRVGLANHDAAGGSYLREFRNKAFREPSWTKAPTPEDRASVRDELLWQPEARFVPLFEARLGLPLAEIEEQIRQAISQMPSVQKIEGIPVQEIKVDDPRAPSVILGSGQEITGSRLIYADHHHPKGFPRVRDRESVSAIQAMFTHSGLLEAPELEGFYGAVHKEAGDEFQRSVWGYFLDGGRRSVWTLLLAQAEIEDNHEIAKKLRRLKQALDKMFSGSGFLPQGQTEFLATVTSEQVRFEESVLFSSGQAPLEPARATQCPKAWMLTDGFGPSLAMQQVMHLLGETTAQVTGLSQSLTQEPSEKLESNAEA